MFETLLDEARKIVKENQAAEKYNIFKVLEVTDKEVMMCRVLADFLNPHGAHGKGKLYLNSFLAEVLKRKDADHICETARVYKEYPITAGRRVDIVISSDDVFIPIEVKIYARDQKAQCFDYYSFAKEKDSLTKVVYLTIWGSAPSQYSMESRDGNASLESNDCICISFADDIIMWLDTLWKEETNVSMKDMILQYKEAIENFTLSLNEDVQMKLIDKIMESEENFKGMLAINEVADKAKARLIYDLLYAFEASINGIREKYGFEREKVFEWYEYRDQANKDYYKQRESTYPGLNYVFKDVILPGGVQLWLRIEVDYALFFGLCLFDPNADGGAGNQMDEPSEEVKEALKQYMDIQEATYDAWWVKWWYLPTGTDQKNAERDLVPDFRSMNDAAVTLSNRVKKKEFIEKSSSVIEKILDRTML